MKLKSIHLCALVLVLVAEFAFFDAMIVRRQAWIYPRWFDQVQYLTEAYRSYERAQDAGIAAGVRETLTNIAPQGTLHDFWALGIFLLFGPSREGALAVNLLALVILQAVTFFAARRLADSWPAAWIGTGGHRCFPRAPVKKSISPKGARSSRQSPRIICASAAADSLRGNSASS